MNVKEKAGDFMLDIAKLIFGGVILAGIVSDNINRFWLYIIGAIVFVACCVFAFMFFKISKRKEE